MPDEPLTLPGVDLPLVLRRSARAQRITLKVDPAGALLRVTAPPKVRLAEIARFVARHVPWAEARLARLPAPVPFADGAVVPILGAPHRIRHEPQGRGAVRRQDGALVAGGRAEHLARRVTDYLKAEALNQLRPRAAVRADRLGVRVSHVGVRDTRTRWGSCSRTGRLSFSWRLVLAPEPVLDYVVAHEVAHLVEMNHSPRFWALVRRLEPQMDAARTWLKLHGGGLHRYG